MKIIKLRISPGGEKKGFPIESFRLLPFLPTLNSRILKVMENACAYVEKHLLCEQVLLPFTVVTITYLMSNRYGCRLKGKEVVTP